MAAKSWHFHIMYFQIRLPRSVGIWIFVHQILREKCDFLVSSSCEMLWTIFLGGKMYFFYLEYQTCLRTFNGRLNGNDVLSVWKRERFAFKYVVLVQWPKTKNSFFKKLYFWHFFSSTNGKLVNFILLEKTIYQHCWLSKLVQFSFFSSIERTI